MRVRTRLIGSALLALSVASSSILGLARPAQSQSAAPPHNVIIFVPDGLRASIVDATTAPEMNEIKTKGVSFANSHSLFPTFTTANASAMATGHYLGDTGDFSNTIYIGYKTPALGLSMTPFLENNPVLQDVNNNYDGNYLDETTVLAKARRAGYQTAAIGKVGPVAIFDPTNVKGDGTIVIDDATGNPAQAWPLPATIVDLLKSTLGTATTPSRGENGNIGDNTHPGTTVANVVQQNFFKDAAAKVVLPYFAQQNRPFVLVFWSRDPDGSQHNQGDSLGKFVPGINGPTSLAAIHNADDDLKALRQALRDNHLEDTTDIIVSADHGFSTISKQSKTSPSTKFASLPGVNAGELPIGFLAIDLSLALNLPLSDPDSNDITVHPDFDKRYPVRGNGLLGYDVTHPDVAIAANGGSDLIYVPSPDAKKLTPAIVKFLLKQDYVSGIFVDDAFGKIPGTLPMSAINMVGRAVMPRPTIVVNFTSFSSGCSLPVRCSVEVADTNLQQGQGMHGSFSRGDTNNFMAAIGPDFKKGFVDPAPVSNADVGMTVARILHLNIDAKGKLLGRAFTEAMPGGTLPAFTSTVLKSDPANGLTTILKYQSVGTTNYFDTAGFPGRTVGL
jgi:arylsulfatase A-like enzyme